MPYGYRPPPSEEDPYTRPSLPPPPNYAAPSGLISPSSYEEEERPLIQRAGQAIWSGSPLAKIGKMAALAGGAFALGKFGGPGALEGALGGVVGAGAQDVERLRAERVKREENLFQNTQATVNEFLKKYGGTPQGQELAAEWAATTSKESPGGRGMSSSEHSKLLTKIASFDRGALDREVQAQSMRAESELKVQLENEQEIGRIKQDLAYKLGISPELITDDLARQEQSRRRAYIDVQPYGVSSPIPLPPEKAASVMGRPRPADVILRRVADPSTGHPAWGQFDRMSGEFLGVAADAEQRGSVIKWTDAMGNVRVQVVDPYLGGRGGGGGGDQASPTRAPSPSAPPPPPGATDSQDMGSGGSVVGNRGPRALPGGTQKELSALMDSYKETQKVEALAKASPQDFGPLSGSLVKVEVNQLRGMGATPEQVKLAVAIQTMIRSRVFETAGKVLTSTEKEFYLPNLPRLDDTFETALTKMQVSLEFLRDKLSNRVALLPPDQKRFVEEALRSRGVGLAPPPGGGKPNPQVKTPDGIWEELPDGRYRRVR